MLSIPKAVEIIAQGESRLGQSPFSGLSTLLAISSYKCDLPTMLWVMSLMLDAAFADPKEVASWTVRALHPKNAQGKFSLWVFKKQKISNTS
jgi:hypothetical protein